MEVTKIVNLTPHDIVLRTDPSNVLEILDTDLVYPSDGRAFITTESETEIGHINGIPDVEIEYGEISDLPDPKPGTIFIVAMPTAQMLAAREQRVDDIRYPDTGNPKYCVRTDKGLPFATRRLLKAKVR